MGTRFLHSYIVRMLFGTLEINYTNLFNYYIIIRNIIIAIKVRRRHLKWGQLMSSIELTNLQQVGCKSSLNFQHIFYNNFIATHNQTIFQTFENKKIK